MPLIEKLEFTGVRQRYHFHCPGCGCSHAFQTCERGGGWDYNDDPVEPTVTPSLLINKDRPASRCHLFITKGKLVFLSDCHHELAGKTVSMEEI